MSFVLPALKRLAIPTIKRINRPSPTAVNAPKASDYILPSRIGLDHNNAFSSIQHVTINVDQTSEFLKCTSLLDQMINNLNVYGICVVGLNHFDNTCIGHRKVLKKNMHDLKPLFGETAFHQKSEPNTGILTIDPRTPNSVNVANTHISHPPHTDGAFQTRPEKIVTVGCEHAAMDGGDTTLICAQSMLEYVLAQIGGSSIYKKEIIEALFEKDAIEIGRKLPSNGNDPIYKELISKQSVLSYLHEYDDNNDIADDKDYDHVSHDNDNLRLVYHGNPTYLRNIREEIKHVWDLMGEYCSAEMDQSKILKFKLEPGQILIMDNTAFLHGRTPYTYNDKNLRVLHRLNFYHNGLLKRSVQLGINKDIVNQYMI